MVEFYGSFIPGDEVYGAVAVEPFETYHFNVEEMKAMWKEFAKVLVQEGILPTEYRDGFFNIPAQIIRHLYEVMDRFQYQPFGIIEHPNGEMEQLLNELSKPEQMRRQFTERELEMIHEYTNIPDEISPGSPVLSISFSQVSFSFRTSFTPRSSMPMSDFRTGTFKTPCRSPMSAPLCSPSRPFCSLCRKG